MSNPNPIHVCRRRSSSWTARLLGALGVAAALAATLGAVGSGATLNRLTSISTQTEGRNVIVVIEAAEPAPYIVATPDPLTVIIDLRNVTASGVAGAATRPIGPVAGVDVEDARAEDGAAVARVRLSLSQPVKPQVRSRRSSILVEFGPGSNGSTMVPAVKAASNTSAPKAVVVQATAPGPKPAPASGGALSLTTIDVTQSTFGTRVTIAGTGPLAAPTPELITTGTPRLVLDLAGVAASAQTVAGSPDGPVARVRVAQHSRQPLVARVVIDLRAATPYRVEQIDGRLAVVLEPKAPAAAATPAPALVKDVKTVAAPAAPVSEAPVPVVVKPKAATPKAPAPAAAAEAAAPKAASPKADAPAKAAARPAAPAPEPVAAAKPPVPMPELPKVIEPAKAPAPVPAKPAAEAPKAEAPKPDAPTVEAAKPEAPKPEAPKPDVPTVEAPKPEAPKPEAPKPEAQKPETQKPEAAKPEDPKSAAPKPEAATPEAPVTPAPVVIAPAEAPKAAPAAAALPAKAAQEPSAKPERNGRPDERIPAGDQKTYTGTPVTFDFQGAELRAVLRTFSEISGLNVVIDPSINGTVDVSLREVPWDQALEIILRANKLGYTIENNVVRIATLKALAEEEQERQKLAEAQAKGGQLRVLTRPLSYARATDLAKLLKDSRVITDRGTAFVDERSNTLIINDLAEALVEAESLIAALDRPEPQVEIEARIVQTTRENARALGVQWGVTGRMASELGNTSPLQFPAQGSISGRTGGTQGNPIGPVRSETPTGVNLPVTGATSAIGIAMGTLNGSFNLDVALSALEKRGHGRILSTPRVVMQNNVEAEMYQGIQIPIQTVSNNTVTVTFKDAALSLKVRPQITASNTVIMNINLENASPDYSREVNGIPPIDTQRAVTQVLVNDSETTVIGGIYVQRETMAKDTVPMLHRIPLLGWLFRRDTNAEDNRELLIFITPKIRR